VFLHNLQELPQHIVGPWLLAGDFNLCRSAADKNNGRVDAHLCTSFNNTLDRLALVEIPLLDRFYTWSNKRDNPTLSNLDRVFANNAQCSAFPDTALTSLPRPTSDHTPLLLTLCTNIPKTTIFRFENAWLHNSSFLPMVLPAWSNAYPQVDTAGHLAACLKVTRTAAKVWNRRNRAPPALIQNCKFIILMFDTFEEYRCLSSAELQARALCRDRLSMAIKARAAYWKQRGKHLAIKEGDANTEFFHAHATQRMRRNQIKGIEVDGIMVTTHQGKTAALAGYYKGIMGNPGVSTWDFDVVALYQNSRRASAALTAPFTEQEALGLSVQ
jgi:hypothetical protein